MSLSNRTYLQFQMDSFPLEIWAQIFSYNYDIESVKSIKLASKYFNYLVTNYLQRIKIRYPSSRKCLSSNFIKSFSCLRFLSSKLVITTKSFSFLEESSLVQATFQTRDPSFLNFYERYFVRHHNKYKLRIIYLEKDKKDVIVTMTPQCLEFNFALIPNGMLITIYQYLILGLIKKLIIHETITIVCTIMLLQQTLIEEITLISPDKKYPIELIIAYLSDHDSFPNIRKFLPIETKYLSIIRKKFPHLREISLLDFPKEEDFIYLESYERITIYITAWYEKLPSNFTYLKEFFGKLYYLFYNDKPVLVTEKE